MNIDLENCDSETKQDNSGLEQIASALFVFATLAWVVFVILIIPVTKMVWSAAF